MKNTTQQPTIKNKRASFEYTFIELFIAGICLSGTEVKSIRAGKVQVQDAYCAFEGTELWIRNLQISPYEMGSFYNMEPKRSRKLLLTKKELRKLKTKTTEKGLTIIPVKLFFSDRNLAKIEIALAKGKNIYDKRESIKEKDLKRKDVLD